MPDLKPQYGHSSDEKVHNVPTIITGAESSQILFNLYRFIVMKDVFIKN